MHRGCNFLQFKDHNLGRRHENQTNDSIFSICFLSPNCLGNLFFYLKIVKIHFHGVSLLAILVCKISEFWSWKLWDYDFVSFDSENIQIGESKKPGFTFFIELITNSKFIELITNSKIFRVISWSTINLEKATVLPTNIDNIINIPDEIKIKEQGILFNEDLNYANQMNWQIILEKNGKLYK